MDTYKELKNRCSTKAKEIEIKLCSRFSDSLDKVPRTDADVYSELKGYVYSDVNGKTNINSFLEEIKEEKIRPYLEEIEGKFYISKESCLELIDTIISDYNDHLLFKKEKSRFYIPEKEYSELIDAIIVDLYYENKLNMLLNDVSNLRPSDAWNDICDEFFLAFEKLRNTWNRTKGKKLFQDEIDLKNAFKIIYERYPQLCKEAFPAVLFIFTDFFYEFRNLCNEPKSRNKTIEENLSYNPKKEIRDLFKCKINGDIKLDYLFSLIDVKHNPYSESTSSQGKLIYDKLLKDAWKYFEKRIQEDPSNREQNLFEDLFEHVYLYAKKIYEDKNKDTQIPIGENFNAIWHFIQSFHVREGEDNYWADYDISFSLFVLNHATTWINCLILSLDKDRVKYTAPCHICPLPITLYAIDYLFYNLPQNDLSDKDIRGFYHVIYRLYRELKNDKDAQKLISKLDDDVTFREMIFDANDYYDEILGLSPPSLTSILSLISVYICLPIDSDDIE